jgi:hypothetical protein
MADKVFEKNKKLNDKLNGGLLWKN